MMEAKKSIGMKQLICIAGAIVLLIACKVLPVPEGLTREGFCAMCLFISTIVLWLGEVFPMWVSALFMYFMFPWYGVMTVSECYSSWGGSSCFFILATFSIAAAMSTTSIPGRVCASIISRFGKNSKLMVLAIVMATSILSLMMSTIAVVSIFIAIIRPIMAEHCGRNTRSNLAKCLYLALPVACNLGGFMAPSSTPGNIVIANMLEQFCGIRISFFQWLIVGVPTSLIFKVLAWAIIVHVFPPEPLQQAVIDKYRLIRDQHVPMDIRESKAIIIIGTTIAAWLLSSWFPFLDTTIVAIVAMLLLMAPGIEVLTAKQLNEHIQWGTVILLGTITGLVSGITRHDVPTWIVHTVFGGISNMPALAIILFCVVFMAVLRNFIPTGTAFVSFMALPMFGVAELAGIDLPAMMFLVSFWSGIILLVPYDPIYFVGYDDGYYTTADTTRAGICLLIPFAILSPVVIFLLAKLIGG